MSESPTSALWRTKTRHLIVIWSLQASEWFVTGQRQSFNLATWSCRSIRVTSITKQNYLGNAKAGTMDPTLPMMQLALGLQLFNATIQSLTSRHHCYFLSSLQRHRRRHTAVSTVWADRVTSVMCPSTSARVQTTHRPAVKMEMCCWYLDFMIW